MYVDTLYEMTRNECCFLDFVKIIELVSFFFFSEMYGHRKDQPMCCPKRVNMVTPTELFPKAFRVNSDEVSHVSHCPHSALEPVDHTESVTRCANVCGSGIMFKLVS